MTPYPKPSRAARIGSKTVAREVRQRKRRATTFRKVLTAYGGDDWLEAKAAVLARDQGRCLWCDQAPRYPTVHHCIPVSCGGGNQLWNLSLLCPRDHQLAQEYRIPRLALVQRLYERYGYPELGERLEAEGGEG